MINVLIVVCTILRAYVGCHQGSDKAAREEGEGSRENCKPEHVGLGLEGWAGISLVDLHGEERLFMLTGFEGTDSDTRLCHSPPAGS